MLQSVEKGIDLEETLFKPGDYKWYLSLMREIKVWCKID